MLSGARTSDAGGENAENKLPDKRHFSLDWQSKNNSLVPINTGEVASSNSARKYLPEVHFNYSAPEPQEAGSVRRSDQKVDSTPPASFSNTISRLEEFTSHAKSLFDKLDVQKSGLVSKSDLAKAMQDPRYTGADAQVLSIFYKDIVGEGLLGLSKGDIERFEKVTQKFLWHTQSADDLSERSSDGAFFRKIAGSNASYATKDTLAEAIAVGQLSPEERKAAQYMYDNFSSIENSHGDRHFWDQKGISTDDMRDYSKKIVDSFEYKDVVKASDQLKHTWFMQGVESSDLFSNKLNPLESINPDAIKQGAVGDCDFEAALASVASSNPKLIKDMIKDNNNGTYTVTFPGNPGNPVTVSTPTEAERSVYNEGSPRGTWASVMEKAYGTYSGEHFWRRSITNPFGGWTPTEGGDGGGHSGAALALLTGHHVETHIIGLNTDAEVASYLTRALKSGSPKALIAGTSGAQIWQGEQDSHNFFRGHMYSVIDFDKNGADGGTVTIRNPWGEGYNTTRGTIRISLHDYRQVFSVNFEEK